MVHLRSNADKGMPAGNFNNVDLPEGYSGAELKAASWWLDHKHQVKRAAIGSFVALDVLLIAAGAWGIFDWLALGGVNEERAMRQLTSPAYAQLGGLAAPREIAFGTPIVLTLDNERYDVVVRAENPNSSYWAELEYAVTVGGQETPLMRDFLLPGQAKFLTALGVRRASAPGRVELRVSRRDWRLVDRHETGDYADYAARRLAFQLSEPSFVPGGGNEPSRTAFTVRNASAFGYRRPAFLILLYRGDAIVGADRVVLEALRAGETRPVELFWFQPLPQVTRTEVLVDVNILDRDAYLAPGN